MTERFPRSLAAPRAALVALSLLVGGLATGAQDARAQALDVSLSADHHFPVLGGEVEITLGGPPGASFTVQGSFTPAERPLGQAGTLFLDPGNLVALGSGVLDMSGSATLTLGVPSKPKLAGRFFFVQAAAMLDGAIGLSRALPFRLGLAPPAGARNPVAIAVTSDGAKAYVGHQKDGSISVLDATADRLVADLPAVAPAGGFAQTAMDLAIDPEDRHLFVAQAGTPFLTVFEVATDSVVARLEVPKGAQRLAFDFRPGRARVYLSNDRDDAVLVFEEGPPGSFTALPSLRLEGSDPSAIAVLADGRLLVGNRGSHEIEVLDPFAAGAPTVARIPLDGLPLDIVVAGAKALVPTFRPTLGAAVDGVNEVAVIDLAALEVEGAALADLGTDYLDLALSAPFVAVVAAGSGTVLVAEAASGRLLDRVELAPGQGPGGIANAIPQAAAFVPAAGGGAPDKLYVVNYFRETVRPVLLDGGPPFALGAEIALARSGAPRVPLADLSPEEDGHWFFRSVAFFQGAAFDPNPTTCSRWSAAPSPPTASFPARRRRAPTP